MATPDLLNLRPDARSPADHTTPEERATLETLYPSSKEPAPTVDPAAPAEAFLYPIEASINRTVVGNLERLGDRTGLTVAQQRSERLGYYAALREAKADGNVSLASLIHTEG